MRDEMGNDSLTDVDVVNVLRAGAVREPESENRSWRYQVETSRIVVVVCFDPEPEDAETQEEIELIIVTAWRK